MLRQHSRAEVHRRRSAQGPRRDMGVPWAPVTGRDASLGAPGSDASSTSTSSRLRCVWMYTALPTAAAWKRDTAGIASPCPPRAPCGVGAQRGAAPLPRRPAWSAVRSAAGRMGPAEAEQIAAGASLGAAPAAGPAAARSRVRTGRRWPLPPGPGGRARRPQVRGSVKAGRPRSGWW
jgi:hypothetical protein